MDQAIEQLKNERKKRIIDAAQLKKPDRVPVSTNLSYFPKQFGKVKASDAYYDFPKWREAYLEAAKYLQPDLCGGFPVQSGKLLEELDSKSTKWPGHGVDANHGHQFVEAEYMKAEEYDLFLRDRADFNIRYLIPRSFGMLKPLETLPPLDAIPSIIHFDLLAKPEFTEALEKLLRISREMVEWQKQVQSLSDGLRNLGFPMLSSRIGVGSPFDMISDFLRGMRGAMLDMYRCPDKLLQAIEMISQDQIKRIAAGPKAKDFTLAFIALHRGAEGFMSIKQFEKFYWPYLKKSVETLVEAGYTPDIFFEGDYTSRLEYLQELPRGHVVGRFDRSDMTKVKQMLGNRMCISGNVPSSLLQTGSIEDVKKYCKWLIDVVGKDGGYIMSSGSSLDEVKPENLKTMVDFTHEYGKY